MAVGAGGGRPRGLGRGRKTRRILSRGGRGPAHRLNDVLAAWPDVRVVPTFGRWGYFVGERLFACFPIRETEHDLWVRLPGPDRARALASGRVRPHRRLARRGWIEVDVMDAADVDRVLGWLRRAHAAAGRGEEET